MINNLLKIINTMLGRTIISIILGLGLASLFRKLCDENGCLEFIGPNMDNINNFLYRHNDKCYKFVPKSKTCDKNKKTVKIN